jgi:hypothetical protein
MIKIEVNTKGELHLETTKDYSINEFTLLLLNTVLLSARDAIAGAPKGQEEVYKRNVYDMLNLRFTGVLETLAPEYELRPGLTEEAIMKAENEMMAEETAKTNAMSTLPE